MIGAGLAGLAAARRVAAQGRQVVVLEAADAVGGRVRSDRRDGLVLDRGFQLVNPAYPEARRVLDLAALRLEPFGRGVALGGGRHGLIADPLRHPRQLLDTLRTVGAARGLPRLVGWLAGIGYLPPARLRARPDRPFGAELARLRLDPALAAVLRTFLAGVLAEPELDSSARMVTMLLRAFVRGTPALPAAGMQAMPDQLASGLPAGAVRLHTPAHALAEGRIQHDGGSIRAAAIIVAADPVTTQRLTGVPAPPMKALTTYYHLVPQPPRHARFLHLDPLREGPVVNTAAVSAVAAGYAPPGITLVASTVLGQQGEELEPDVRRHAARILNLSPAQWQPVASYPIPAALPAHPPGQPLRRRVDLGGGVFLAGDHRDTPSIQGALVSGRRAADAALAYLSGPQRHPAREMP